MKSAGSCFINPVVDDRTRKQFEREAGVTSHGGRVPAGWLIDKVGLRGKVVGGAAASEQHPNYIVNAGGATAADVIELTGIIKKKVHDTFNVTLEEEIKLLGF